MKVLDRIILRILKRAREIILIFMKEKEIRYHHIKHLEVDMIKKMLLE